MLLQAPEFKQKAQEISKLERGIIGFDFETNGLSAYRGDKAFLMGFTDPDGNKFCCKVKSGIDAEIGIFFSNERLIYAMHNAKFEMAFLRKQFGIDIKGTIWDTEVMARVQNNSHMKYSLQSCAERIGHTKYVPMLDWLKQKGNKNKYHLAPSEIVCPYVEQDAWLSWELSRQQIDTFKYWDSTNVPIHNVCTLETDVIRPLFDMEERGLLIDVYYCKRAAAYEEERAKSAQNAFYHYAGCRFVDSGKALAPIFDKHGIGYGKTDLGNPSFTEETLEVNKSHPIVRSILDYRNAKKRHASYWTNFLELEHNGLIHPNIRQNRAATGRMSVTDPACQTWPDDGDNVEYPIRRAFIAEQGCKIVSIDYNQLELRLMCDEAGDSGMIAKILSGVDFHIDVANMAGVSRQVAKQGRFAKLYGAGVKKVAQTLNISEVLSRKICDAIDNQAPRVAEYSRELITYAEQTKQGYNYLGRRFFFKDDFYKYPNYRIQSAGCEILKTAIVTIDKYIRGKHPKTRILLPLHDELFFNIHESDLSIVVDLQRIMKSSYSPKNGLPLEVSTCIGNNMHDMEVFKP